MSGPRVTSDRDWVRQAFMLNTTKISQASRTLRGVSSSSAKFTDTTPGGNFSINNPPQPTRSADRKANNLFNGSKGMGRAYSEAIDDNASRVSMRFGVAEYNSIDNFFLNFYNQEAGRLARHGESAGFAFSLGKAIGAIASVPLLPFVYAGKVWRYLAGTPYSKYYYLKPTAPLYWNAVNTIVNALMVNMEMLPSVWADKFSSDSQETRPDLTSNMNGSDAIDWDVMSSILPDIFRSGSGGGVDVYAIANRAQRLEGRYRTHIANAIESGEADAIVNAITELQTTDVLKKGGTNTNTTSEYLKLYFEADVSKALPTDSEEKNADQSYNPTWRESYAEHFMANIRDGSDWVTFKMDEVGSISETFSNSTKESEIASSINSLNSRVGDVKNTFMNFNVSDGLIGSTVGAVMSGVGDVMSGAAEGVGIGGLGGLVSGSSIDIPDIYDSSSAELPKESYTIQLRTPYGNKVSILTNLYIPLAMLLAGALPLSTGKRSYTSPFLCELFSQGRSLTRLGIIDSLSITRGTSNIAWSVDGLPLGIDVTFSVTDLSPAIHMPITDGMGAWDDDTAFTNYMSVLGNLGMDHIIYPTAKFARRMQNRYVDWKSVKSPAAMAMNYGAFTTPGRVLSAFSNHSGLSNAGR